jgi:hypothetical protein
MKEPSTNADFVVLLTATIAPKARIAAGLKRSDPKVRLRDYERALKFWLDLPEAPWMAGIVFAENSGHPLESLKAVAATSPRGLPVEFLSYDEPEPPEGFSYGYSEFKLMRKAVQESPLIASHRYFIKATGRYLFPDVSKLVARLPKDFKIAVDARRTRPFTVHAPRMPSCANRPRDI